MMRSHHPPSTMISLEREECIRLLEICDFGRLAIVQGEVPAIFPVNYVMHGDSIVLRTGPGTKLWHGPGHLVAFEIDSVSHETRTGWSVVVTGRLEELSTAESHDVGDLHEGHLDPWAPGPKAHWLRLVPGIVTGRRVVVAPS